MKLSICILAFFMLTISISINADQNSHLAAAERFLVISKEAEQNKQLLQQIQNQSKYDLQNMFKQSKVTDEQKHIYEKYRKRMMYILFKELSWEKHKSDFINIYASVFTKQELLQLIDFFESPLGKMYIEKEQIVLKKKIDASRKSSIAVGQKIRQLSKEMKDELK